MQAIDVCKRLLIQFRQLFQQLVFIAALQQLLVLFLMTGRLLLPIAVDKIAHDFVKVLNGLVADG